MGLRYLLVMSTIVALCVLSPLRPVLGLYGYYWFGMMRPDILSWAGPNRYSLILALVTLFSNAPSILRNLPLLFTNSILRNQLVLFLLITISVITAVDPSLCTERYLLFVRIFLMALIIPLAITKMEELRWFFVVVAGSLGLLGAKFGLFGLIHGGLKIDQGYGGFLSDNNTLALAFAMNVPLCWFSRHFLPWRLARLGFVGLSLLCISAVLFSHSRGGALALGAAVLLITLSERRKIVALLMLLLAAGGVSYLVWDSFYNRMATLKDPMAEDSARSRIIFTTYAAPRMWLDYPLFGVGFTETNQQRLLWKYVPPEYSVAYAGRVLHNTYAQILVDSGIFAFLVYMWLLLKTGLQTWFSAKRIAAKESMEKAAIPFAVSTSLGTFLVGATFLSRTTFDLFYVLLCATAAWIEIGKREQAQPAAAAVLHANGVSAARPAGVMASSAGEGHPAALAHDRARFLGRRARVRTGAPGLS